MVIVVGELSCWLIIAPQLDSWLGAFDDMEVAAICRARFQAQSTQQPARRDDVRGTIDT